MSPTAVLLLAFAIGVVAGLRPLTAPTLVAWAAHLGWLQLHGTRLSFMSSIVTACIFTVLALGEFVADQRPSTPARTAPVGLTARILLGGLSGACLAVAAGQSLVVGSALGAAGGVVGAFAGYHVRTGLVRVLEVRDLVIALAEDAFAIAAALLIVTRL
jgi:uncharacterized membrane protein